MQWNRAFHILAPASGQAKRPFLFRSCIADLTDTHVRVDQFLGSGAEEFLETARFASRRQMLESRLRSALSGNTIQGTEIVAGAVSEINRRHGNVRVRDLATICNLSERQLERLFLERVGLSPKFYARIQRFRSVLNHLDDPAKLEQPKIADVAAI